MPNTALNRTTQALLTNKSGGALNYGDVVVLDNTNANGFTTTTSGALSTRGIGVILEPLGIANNASGMVAIGGWCPQVNLNTAAAVGQFIKTHTVAGQGTPHASPQVEGDFAVALTASATPAANLFGSANGPTSGSSTPGGSDTQVQYNNSSAFGGITGATTNGTALTLVAPILGTPASGALTNCTSIPVNQATGDLPFANLTQIAGLSVLGVTGSATADVAAITAGTDGYVLTRVSSSSLAFAAPYGHLITETVTTSSATSVSFTSIPATYRDLRVVVRGRSAESALTSFVLLRFNTDSGSNYDYIENYIITTTNASNQNSQGLAQSVFGVPFIPGATATATTAGTVEYLIEDYKGTTFHKNGLYNYGAKWNTTTGTIIRGMGWADWRSTAAITQIDVTLNGGSAFVDNSVVSLYGIF